MTYVFVIGLTALMIKLIWDWVARRTYILVPPKNLIRHVFWFYIWSVLYWAKRRARSIWAWCKRLLASIRKTPAIALTYTLFVSLVCVFVVLFFVQLYPLIKSLNELVGYQIENISIGSRAFRNASLSVAGSITLSIAALGVILTVIRNLLTREQNRTDEERLVTEQISRSVDQIGAYKQSADGKILEPNMEVRLGGLYSLQRIMKNSQSDEDSIAKIFYAYVRENAK